MVIFVNKALVVTLFLALIGLYLVGSVTRTISDLQDNKDTLVRNSNGRYWEPLGSNIQLAIDDLGSPGGMVWLPGGATIALDSGIVMGEQVVLDMQGATLKPTASFHVITMKQDAQVKNGKINVRDINLEDDHACIYFDGVERFNYGSTGVFNMDLRSRDGRGTGIYYFCDNDPPITEYMMWTTCDNVYTERFKYGLRIHATGGTDDDHSFINGNIFTNFKQWGDEYFIHVKRDADSYNDAKTNANGNFFHDFELEVHPDTKGAIYCDGRYNSFEVFTWDWRGDGAQADDIAYQFTDLSERNMVVGNSLKKYGVDEGRYNTFMDHYFGTLFINKVNATNFYFPTEAPSSYHTKPGSAWFDPGTNELKIYDGSTWGSIQLT